MNDQQLLRYSRHILLNEIGIEGQEYLLGGHALIIGMGGQSQVASAQETRHAINRACLAQRKPLPINALESSLARDPHCRVRGKTPPNKTFSDPVDGATPQHCRNVSCNC